MLAAVLKLLKIAKAMVKATASACCLRALVLVELTPRNRLRCWCFWFDKSGHCLAFTLVLREVCRTVMVNPPVCCHLFFMFFYGAGFWVGVDPSLCSG